MQEHIIELIKGNLKEIIPEIDITNISMTDSLTEIGANSVDRGELITMTLERLDLNIPRIEFFEAQSIMDLSSLIISKMKKYDIQ